MKTTAYVQELLKALKSTAVLVTSGSARPNVMTVGWGAFGTLWNKNVFILPVRTSRYSHGLIEQSGVFTVSVPRKDLTDVIMRCSGLSGRDHDKFSELHLHPVSARTVDTYIVGDCGLHFECRVIYRAAMLPEALDPALNKDVYGGKNYHTLFYGEVLAVYET